MKEGKIILYQNYFMHRTEIWVQTKRELKYTNTLQNFFRLDPKKNVEWGNSEERIYSDEICICQD